MDREYLNDVFKGLLSVIRTIFARNCSGIFLLGSVDICFFKVNNGNTRTMGKISTNLRIKKLDGRQMSYYDVVIGNFEQISHTVLVLSLFTLDK